jgi:hypothetical protein
LNDQYVIKEIRGKIKNTESNENENTTSQSLWDTANAVLRRKLIDMST